MRRIVVSLILLIGLAVIAGAWLKNELTQPYRGYSEPQVFVDIPRGTSRRGIASLLKDKGVIRSEWAFALLTKWHRHSALEAGEYRFDHPMTPVQVFAQIAGGHIYVHTIIVPEGWTSFDIARELERQGLCRHEDFQQVVGDPSLVHDVAPGAKSLEGFLFPSTYEFSKHVTPEEIAATMVRHFREEWGKLNADAPAQAAGDAPTPVSARSAARQEAPQPLSPIEVITLASLIERETPQPKERPIVASVFYNRLRIGLPLQCDPTVQYALYLAGTPKLDVTPEDLHIASPYNTYLHRGLPPGPIANPGDASLLAALHPARTHYLYFVANDSSGHFFADTLVEHNRNVARYRRLKLGLPAEPPPPPARPKPKPSPKSSAKHLNKTKKKSGRRA
ncbi:MAG TPA: endolytic transglycosylase MltG [Candidatus Acidoferrales bacterium]|nr:endolytic transglycosylase MltG [Candidatus Acidoferrales bacterium]